MFIHDIYILEASNHFEIEANEEVTVNMGLKRISPCYNTLLRGYVLYKCSPLKNATVLILDSHFNPLFHTVTNDKGVYKFRNLIRPGKYNVIATAIGYKISVPKSIRIETNKVTNQSFLLKKNWVYANGIVYGQIFEAKSRKSIENAIINLIDLTDGCKMSYKTTSNHSGQYLIHNILPGRYRMTAKKQGYKVSSVPELIIAKNDCIVLDIDLIKRYNL